MTDKESKLTAASLAAVAVAAFAWMTMPAGAQQQAAAVSDQALIGPGKTTYAQKCSHCHGPNMVTAGTVAPDLRAFPDDNARFTTTVKQGRNNMPPWKDILSDQEITEVWAFVSSRRNR
jgi:mono/diheme cytochrome c family protein